MVNKLFNVYMNSFDSFIFYLTQSYNKSLMCASLPMQTEGCAKFWGVCYLVVISVLCIIFYKILRSILRNKADFKAYEKRMIERAKVADEETMKKVQWQDEDAFDDLDEMELAKKMRQELQKSKFKSD